MTGVADLPGLPLPTVRGAPHYPVIAITYRITRIPEFRSDTSISTVLQQFANLAVLNLVPHLRSELKIIPAIIYRPGPISFHENSGIGI